MEGFPLIYRAFIDSVEISEILILGDCSDEKGYFDPNRRQMLKL
jgi:hypothetical protein